MKNGKGEGIGPSESTSATMITRHKGQGISDEAKTPPIQEPASTRESKGLPTLRIITTEYQGTDFKVSVNEEKHNNRGDALNDEEN